MRKLGVEGSLGTLEEAGFPDDHFDAVAMSSIIEHLYDPLATLREVNRVLKPNGWLWFDAPNEDGLYMQFGNLYMRLQRKPWVIVMAPTFPPYHVQGFNPRSLREILKRSGLSLKTLKIRGEVVEQTGAVSLRKNIENKVAWSINWIGKLFNRGMYMSIWAQKEQ